jgi:hypothetical protein
MAKHDLIGAMRKSAKGTGRPMGRPRTTDQPVRPGRAKLENITGYFEPAVKTQLKMLGVEKRQTIQRLLSEALNLLFAKNGKPEVASLDN